jgi:hypothetical protein
VTLPEPRGQAALSSTQNKEANPEHLSYDLHLLATLNDWQEDPDTTAQKCAATCAHILSKGQSSAGNVKIDSATTGGNAGSSRKIGASAST